MDKTTVLTALRYLLENLQSSAKVTVQLPNGAKAKFHLPSPVSSPPAVDQAPAGGCAFEIISVLRQVGHRLTTTEIMSELERRSLSWSETTVKHTLANLMDAGTLTNCQSSRPKGYGLPEW